MFVNVGVTVGSGGVGVFVNVGVTVGSGGVGVFVSVGVFVGNNSSSSDSSLSFNTFSLDSSASSVSKPDASALSSPNEGIVCVI